MDGEVKIVITPQLVHDIFEEFPVVARAYSENVPEKVSYHVQMRLNSKLKPHQVIRSRVLESILPIEAV